MLTPCAPRKGRQLNISRRLVHRQRQRINFHLWSDIVSLSQRGRSPDWFVLLSTWFVVLRAWRRLWSIVTTAICIIPRRNWVRDVVPVLVYNGNLDTVSYSLTVASRELNSMHLQISPHKAIIDSQTPRRNTFRARMIDHLIDLCKSPAKLHERITITDNKSERRREKLIQSPCCWWHVACRTTVHVGASQLRRSSAIRQRNSPTHVGHSVADYPLGPLGPGIGARAFCFGDPLNIQTK